MGRPYWFRRRLTRLKERYLLAVPSNTLVRDLEFAPPAYGGRGRHPNRPWIRVDKWAAALDESDWIDVDVRDGANGSLIVEVVKRSVVAHIDQRQEGHEEVLVVIRYRDRDDRRVVKSDYYLSNGSPDIPVAEFARVAKAEHRIEECIQRSKSEAGLTDYEVRKWKGWHHHQTLSLIATWFLIGEARRGEKMDPSHYRSADPRRHRFDPSSPVWMRYTLSHRDRPRTSPQTQRTCSPIPLETA